MKRLYIVMTLLVACYGVYKIHHMQHCKSLRSEQYNARHALVKNQVEQCLKIKPMMICIIEGMEFVNTLNARDGHILEREECVD